MTFREAIRKALDDEMTLDSDVVLLGEDVGIYGGCFKVSEGLLAKHPKQVFDTPVSEEAFTGMAVGAAMMGMRPVIEIMYADFYTLAIDPIVNHAAKTHFMSGGQFCCPLVIRLPEGSGTGHGAQHTQSPEAIFMNTPGLKIVVPSCPSDAYHLLRASVRDNNPVLFFEHKALYDDIGDISSEPLKIGEAKVIREGSDVTLISYSHALKTTKEVAQKLDSYKIKASIVDLCTVSPIDRATILKAVRKTGRAVFIQDTVPFGSVGDAVVSMICSDSETFGSLKKHPLIISGSYTPTPFDKDLEAMSIPSSVSCVEQILKMF